MSGTSFIIKKPWITEKSTGLNAVGQYVFMVKPDATKNEIRKAIKEIYRVDATEVRIVTHRGKARRFRGIRGETSGYKKAIISLKDGQKIDLGV